MATLRGGRVWVAPLLALAALILGPLLLLRTPLAPLATLWAALLALAVNGFVMVSLVGFMARATTPPITYLERGLRRWVAAFAPCPEQLWLQWARAAHTPAQGHWCLERALAVGGAEALFQEGLVWLEGGLGPGGQTAGVERLRRAAELEHPEAAFRYAEALRVGQGCGPQPAGAEAWYQRSAAAGFGPAAVWLAQAYEAGDGVTPDAERALHWGERAARLAPHPPLSHSLLRHDAAPGDVAVRWGRGFWAGVDQAAALLVAHRAGRWVLGCCALILVGAGLVATGIIFLQGSANLHHLPLLMLAPSALLLGWQARQLRGDRPRQGRDRLREAAEAGSPEACFQLGLAHQQGASHRPKDALEAFLWFRRAAEGGHRGAMAALGQAYLAGDGVLRNPREAARWLQGAEGDR